MLPNVQLQISQRQPPNDLHHKMRPRQQITHALTVAGSPTLSNIDAARSRLQTGIYGNCEHCEPAIPFEHPESLPMARLCTLANTRRKPPS